MTSLLNVRAVGELCRIVDRLHDRWFDIDQVVIEPNTHVVTIPFPNDGIRLVVRQANALRIDDEERVGEYDLNTLRFDAARGCLSISTGVPMTMEIDVASLDLVLETL